MWLHVQLPEQIRPWGTLACCWDVGQPTNKQTLNVQLQQLVLCYISLIRMEECIAVFLYFILWWKYNISDSTFKLHFVLAQPYLPPLSPPHLPTTHTHTHKQTNTPTLGMCSVTKMCSRWHDHLPPLSGPTFSLFITDRCLPNSESGVLARVATVKVHTQLV